MSNTKQPAQHKYIPTQLHKNAPCAWANHPDSIGDPEYYCGKTPGDPVHIRAATSTTVDGERPRKIFDAGFAATTPTTATSEPWRDGGGHAWEIRQNVTCVECPHCCFTFAAVHTDGYSNSYLCPNCEGCPDVGE